MRMAGTARFDLVRKYGAHSYKRTTAPSTNLTGPLGISPIAALASSSSSGSSVNVHASSPPYSFGRSAGCTSSQRVGPGSLPRTWILFRVFSSNQPCQIRAWDRKRNHNTQHGAQSRTLIQPQIVGKKPGELTTAMECSVSG